MNTYVVKMYFEDLDEKVKEVVFQCKPNEVDDYTKKRLKYVNQYTIEKQKTLWFL